MKKFAVLGNPIAHSKSPEIHGLFAQQFGHDINYKRVLAAETDFSDSIRKLIAEQYMGVNVTLPFKRNAFELADELSKRASIAGAVNTLSFHQGKIFADNTDGQGLVEDLQRILGSIEGKRILLIGAGGAARGSILPLLNALVKSVVVFNRTAEKADVLAKQFASSGGVSSSLAEELCNYQFDIVINSTSSSVTGDIPQLKSNVFREATLAYDMFYANTETAFMALAKQQESQILTADGFGMLVGQAAESYRIWHGVKPDIDAVIKVLRS